MKIFLFQLFFLWSCFFAVGQNPTEINEKREVKEHFKKGDSLRAINAEEAFLAFRKGLAIALDNNWGVLAATGYKKIGVLHYRHGDYEKSELAYRKGLKQDSLSTAAADLLYNISFIKMKQNQQDSVLVYLEKSLKLYERFKLGAPAYNAFLRAGVVYKDRQLYYTALEYTIKAYNGFKTIGDHVKLSDAATNLGNIQNQLKNYNQAVEYHLEALKFSNQANNGLRTGISHVNLANVYGNLKQQDSAISNYKKALEYFDENSTQNAVLLNNLAGAYQNMDNFDLAHQYYDESIEVNQILKDTMSLLYNFNGLTDLYLAENNLTQAKIYLDSVNAMLPSVKNKRISLEFYQNQVEYYKKAGRYKDALVSHENYSNLYGDLYSTDQSEIIQSLQAKFDYEKKENEILKLTLANRDNQLRLIEQNESLDKKNLTLLVLGLAIILSLIGHYLFIQKQKVKNQEVKIEKLEAIYQGQEAIKRRIARDLHDIITTNYDGFRLRILALKRSNNLNEKIDGITDDLKKMNQQIRVVSHRLSPLEMHMGQQKFTDIIKSRLSEFQLYGNIFVELENELPEILNKVGITIQNNFYGILLEILNNVEKHSMATKIKIDNFTDASNHVHFWFKDNGIGIEHNHKEGIGLLNIKQRVEILDGKCEIKNVQSGTEVHINFPIPEKA